MTFGSTIDRKNLILHSRISGIPMACLTRTLSLGLNGGKGGFGSLLKGQGMVARVDNFEACRDLSGRRIRHINNEIRLKEWQEKQEERKKAEPLKVPSKRKKPDVSEYKSAVAKSKSDLKSAILEGFKRSDPRTSLAKPSPRSEKSIIKKIKLK